GRETLVIGGERTRERDAAAEGKHGDGAAPSTVRQAGRRLPDTPPGTDHIRLPSRGPVAGTAGGPAAAGGGPCPAGGTGRRGLVRPGRAADRSHRADPD